MLNSLIFTRSSTVPIAHIAPAVVAVFVEAIDVGNLTAADVVAVVGVAEFAEFQRLRVLRFQPEIQNLKSKFADVSVVQKRL
ncbi:hypothetical protein [Microcoleus sp. S13C4]|uniref:hypothetical protein n=1 Tax=Microcoleus sp. S13C4 TaxID=3055410 RepID=UPI002FCE9821